MSDQYCQTDPSYLTDFQLFLWRLIQIEEDSKRMTKTLCLTDLNEDAFLTAGELFLIEFDSSQYTRSNLFYSCLEICRK